MSNGAAVNIIDFVLRHELNQASTWILQKRFANVEKKHRKQQNLHNISRGLVRVNYKCGCRGQLYTSTCDHVIVFAAPQLSLNQYT